MSEISRRFGDLATLTRELLVIRADLDKVAECSEHVRYCFSPIPKGWEGNPGRPPCVQHDGSWTPRQPHLSSHMFGLLDEAAGVRLMLQTRITAELAEAGFLA